MRHSRSLYVGFAAMLSAMPAIAAVQIQRDNLKTVYDVQLDGLTFKSTNIGGMDFVAPSLTGAGAYAAIRYELGKPELPVVRFMVDGDVRVNVMSELDSGEIGRTKKIKPSQSSWSKSQKFAPPVSFDVSMYSENKMSQRPDYEIEDAGTYRGVRRHLVTLNAMKYNPVTGEYLLQKHYKVTVQQKQNPEDALQPTLALVVGAQFASSASLQHLVQLKETQGFRVRKLVLGQNGLKDDVSIRAALKAIYNEHVNLKFAILVGDVEDVPSHESSHIAGVTDHYFRCIDGLDYESDVNAPDIGVGRISVRNETQLATVVGKIDRYMDGRFASDQWMNHPAFVTTHDRYQVAEGTHNAVSDKFFAPKKYESSFPKANEVGGDKLYPITLKATPEQIVENMKQGRFIINYSGHGSNVGWEDVTTNDVLSLNDPNALPWVIANACITGDFRVESVFGETWLRHPQGAIVYWGSMDSSYWDEDDILEKGLYDAVFLGGNRSFDLLHQQALAEVWRFYGGQNRSVYYRETYVTFGDPSLEVRLAKSQDARLEGPESLVLGADSASWHISDMNGPVQGAHVTLSRAKDGRAITASSNKEGEAKLDLTEFGASVDKLNLTLHGADVRKETHEMPVIIPHDPFLGFSNWVVNGRSTGELHVGEVVRLGATVENFGALATSGGMLKIVKIDGPATIVNGQSQIQGLNSRQRQVIDTGLSFQINLDAQKDQVIRVSFEWATQEGQKGTLGGRWTFVRGELEVVGLDYGNSSIESIATDGMVYLTVRNTGTETIKSAKLTPSIRACTTKAEGSLEISELAPGASLRLANPVHVYADHLCPSGSTGVIALNGSYEGGAHSVAIGTQTQYLIGTIESDVERIGSISAPIPDNGPALEKTILIKGTGRIKDVSLEVKITHPYIGDLTLKLVSPDGKEVLLHSRTGASNHDLNQRYGRGGIEIKELQSLVGSEAHGEWKVIVKDEAVPDVGMLEELELTVRHW